MICKEDEDIKEITLYAEEEFSYLHKEKEENALCTRTSNMIFSDKHITLNLIYFKFISG
jgi:hypothetical protein